MDRQQPSTPASQTKRPQLRVNDVALQLTMKWIERSSDVAELAVNDPKLAEAQAIAVGRFFNAVRNEIGPGFKTSKTRRPTDNEQEDTPEVGVASEA